MTGGEKEETARKAIMERRGLINCLFIIIYIL
jgi:hypothetical protein